MCEERLFASGAAPPTQSKVPNDQKNEPTEIHYTEHEVEPADWCNDEKGDGKGEIGRYHEEELISESFILRPFACGDVRHGPKLSKHAERRLPFRILRAGGQ